MADKHEDTLFAAGKAKWLLENARQLTSDQRALLIAIADLAQSSGRAMTDEEHQAVDKLIEMQEGYDPRDIERAIQHITQAKTKRKVVDWPSGLWAKVRKKKS